jgi:hypothetical protein
MAVGANEQELGVISYIQTALIEDAAGPILTRN